MQRVDYNCRPATRTVRLRVSFVAALLWLTACCTAGFAQLTFDNFPPDLTLACPDAATVGNLTASGGCAPAVITVADGPATPGSCNGTVARTFTATDGCETITGTQTLTLNDEDAPVITITQPALAGFADGDVVFVECNSGFAMDVNSATATDNCGTVASFEFVESFGQAFDCVATGQIASMNCGWRAVDACGNESTLTLTIIIRDTEAPQLLGTPVDATASCGNVPAPAPVAATDQCDATVSVDFVEVRTNLDCGGNYRLTRTWTATDNCNNATQHVQVIDVTDTEAPVLSGVPDDVLISCTTPPAPPVVTAEDACAGTVTVAYNETINGTVCNGATVTRTWTATDDCGLTTAATQVITIADDLPPVIAGVPADVTIACDQALPVLPQIDVTDDCTTLPQFDFSENTTVSGCARTTTRSWSATDNCGNVTNATQRITQIDQTAPSLSPANALLTGVADGATLEFECGAAATFGASDVAVTDDCTTGIDATLVVTNLSDAACDRTTRYTWTATDDCGNVATYTVFVRVRDTQPPVLGGVPVDATHPCGAVPTAPVVTAVDNCSLAPVAFTEAMTGNTCAGRRLVRTWTAADACGNTVSAVQNIVLLDTEAPVLTGVPADVDLGCGDVPAPANVTATDACDGNLTVVYSESSNGTDCANLEIVRIWTATDLCGNTASAEQRIRISDEEAPQFTQAPPTLNFSCNKEIPAPQTPAVTDNCDTAPTVAFSETTLPGNCPQRFSLVRTWTATDDCGNATSITQTINFTDTEAPQFGNLPADLSLECTEGLPDPAAVPVTDNCDDNPVVAVETELLSGTDVCSGLQYRRTYTATDACGNAATAEQTITLTDNTAPVLAFVHPALTQYKYGDTILFECNNFFDLAPTVTAVDACDDDVPVSFVDIPTPAADCAAASYLVELRCIWTATDDCGNTADFVVIVRLVDTTAPVFDCAADLTIAVGQAVPAAVLPPVTDNCTDNVSTTFEEVQVSDADGCGYTLTRTWGATDECGNVATCQQVLTVQEACGCPDITVAQVTINDADCAADNGIVTVTMADPGTAYSFVWTPNLGTPNATGNQRTNLPPGDYLIAITDPDVANADCETKVSVTVGETECTSNDPCTWDYFGEDDTAVVNLSSPDYCLPFNAVNDFDAIFFNGANYTPPPNPCAIDSLVYYSYFLVVAQGSDGPYRVDSWTYPGGVWTGIVQNMDDLAQQMAQLDPSGNWVNNPSTFIIDGAQTLNGYGQLIITHLDSDITTTIQRNYTGAAFGTAHTFEEPGDYVWEVYNAEGCVDSLLITVVDDIVPLQEDTLYVDVAYQTATAFCLEETYLPGSAVATLTLESPQSGFIDDGVPCATYLPFNGFSGLDDALLVLCDDTGVCDTTRVIFNVGAGLLADPCGPPLFEQALTAYELSDCGATVAVCAAIPEGQAANFVIYQNGAPYTGPVTGCSFDTTYSYSYFLLPGGGQNGPYHLHDWLVNGEAHQLTFNDYTELIAQMNVWDPSGQWTDQQDGLSIEGGNPDHVYGALRITHQPTGILSHLELNEGIDVIGVALRVARGTHELVLLNTLSGCADTSQLSVTCPGIAQRAATALPDPVRLKSEATATEEPTLQAPVLTAADDFVTNGFSPNNDGVNDYFQLLDPAATAARALTVYNRYGTVVYQTAHYHNNWDGTQAGQALPEGIYFYLLGGPDGPVSGYVALRR